MNGVKWTWVLLAAVCVLLITISGVSATYATSTENEAIAGQYDNCDIAKPADNAGASVKQHTARYKKRYYIASRRVLLDAVLTNPFFDGPISSDWFAAAIAGRYFSLSTSLSRPFYYTFLHLCALF